jgi:regulator of nucleoside diphosphate kinase
MTTIHETPSIVITNRDHERLSALAVAQHGPLTQVSRTLALELDLAEVVEPTKVPPSTVTMNSRVLVRDEGTGKELVFTLVYPSNEDISIGNLSILTPAGVALIGLAKGETLAWITRDGQTKELTVVEILYQPEANGRLDL